MMKICKTIDKYPLVEKCIVVCSPHYVIHVFPFIYKIDKYLKKFKENDKIQIQSYIHIP